MLKINRSSSLSSSLKSSRMLSEDEKQKQSQNRLRVIFDKVQHIIEELQMYRDRQTQASYEQSIVQKIFNINQAYDLMLRPIPNVPIMTSNVGCQTDRTHARLVEVPQESIIKRVITKQTENAENIITSRYISSNATSRFHSGTVFKQICLNSPNILKQSHSRSNSKGLSLTTSRSKIKQKIYVKPKITLAKKYKDFSKKL